MILKCISIKLNKKKNLTKGDISKLLVLSDISKTELEQLQQELWRLFRQLLSKVQHEQKVLLKREIRHGDGRQPFISRKPLL